MYTITNFFRETGQLTVKFIELDTDITIDLPIIDNKFPEGDELDSYIKGFVPIWVIERKNNLSRVINTDYFSKYVALTDETVEERSKRLRELRDHALRECDWVMLPDTGFSSEAISRFKKYRQDLRDVPQQSGFPFDVEWPSQVTGEWPNHIEKN
jgi:hypothetical protein